TAHHNLGIAYARLPAGDRAENVGRAIAHYEAALRVYSAVHYPRHWASTKYHMGCAFARSPAGVRTENLRRAVACFQAALQFWPEDEFPEAWGAASHRLDLVRKELARLEPAPS